MRFLADETREGLRTLRRGLGTLLRRPLVRVALLFLILVGTARLSVDWIFGVALRQALADLELECEWEDLELAVLFGRSSIEHLTVSHRGTEAGEDPEPPLVAIEYALFDLDVEALFGGRLSIGRAEVDGCDLRVSRDEAGRWNLGRNLDLADLFAGDEEAAVVDEEPGEPPSFDFESPLSIGALRLQVARIFVEDRSIEPPVNLVLEANARLSNLGSPTRPVLFGVSLTGNPLLDRAHVEGTLDRDEGSLVIDLEAGADGLEPAVLAPYLVPLDMRPGERALSATMKLSGRLEPVDPEATRVRGHLALRELALDAGPERTFGLDALDLDFESLGPERAEFGTLALDGLTGRVAINEEGSLVVAGIELLSRSEEPQPSSAAAPGTEAIPTWAAALGSTFALWQPESWPDSAVLVVREDPRAFPWKLERFELTHSGFALSDGTLDPPAELAVGIESLSLSGLHHELGIPAEPIAVQAELLAPGVIESITVSGSVQPFAPERSLDLTLGADEVVLATLHPYLSERGLEPALESGQLAGRLTGAATTDADGRTRAWLELDGFELHDAGRLFSLGNLKLSELYLDPGADLLRVGAIELTGSHLSVSRDPSQAFLGFGLRTVGAATVKTGGQGAADETPNPPPKSVSRRPSASGPPPVLPRVEIERIAWTDIELEVLDEASEPPRRVGLDRSDFELTGLVLGGDPAGEPAPPAQVKALLVAEGIVEELTLEGTLLSMPGELDLTATLSLAGRGLEGALIHEYAAPLGVEPAIAAGTLTLDLEARVQSRGSAWHAGLDLANFDLSSGGERLVSLEALELDELHLGGETPSIGRLRVVGPTLASKRDAGGGLILGPLRFPPPDPEAEVPAPDPDAPPADLSFPTLPPFELGELAIEDVRFTWEDRAVDPPHATALSLDFSATEVHLGAVDRPIPFEARLSADEIVGAASLSGTLQLEPDALRLATSLRADGLRGLLLARYLPPGVRWGEDAGALRFDLEAALVQAPEGGLAATLELDTGDWRAEGAAEPWFAFERLAVDVPRFDPAAGEFVLGSVRFEGSQLAVERSEAGALAALGLVVEAPVEEGPADGLADEGEAQAPRLASARLRSWPNVRLEGGIDVGLDRLRFFDRSLGAEAQPLVLGARFAMPGPQVLLDQDPEGLPALRASLSGSVERLVEAWQLDLELAPFLPEPELFATFAARGLRTQGVPELLPELASTLSGSVEEGELHATLEARLQVERTSPVTVELSRGFAGEVLLEGLRYLDGPEGELLAGLDSIQAEIQRVEPERGNVHLSTVEVDTPRARFLRDDRGLHAFGFTIASVEAEGAPPKSSLDSDHGPLSEEPPVVEASAPRAEPPSADATASAGGELRVDELLVGGLDVLLRDQTGTPPVSIPLNSLDLELKHWSSRASVEPIPIQFSAYLGSQASEQAPALFDELVTSGRVVLAPTFDGWVQIDLAGLELVRFAGLAAKQGVNVGDGSLDAGVRVRAKPGGGATVSSSLVFTDLQVSEPDGGPIQRLLSLPATLDAVLFLLRNQNGEHRVSVSFGTSPGGLSSGSLALTATRALTEVLARAVAASPLRVTGMLGLGLLQGDKERVKEEYEVEFAPGSTRLSPAARDQLAELVTRLERKRSLVLVLRHRVGLADLERARLLANPSREECLDLSSGLRRKKEELLRRRSELALETRAFLAVGQRDSAAQNAALLRELDAELASTEAGLDAILEILRNDTERHHEKRAKAASLTIAAERLEAAEALIAALGWRIDPERIDLRSPRWHTPDEELGRLTLELTER